jgi:site-specific recombinase XerD
MAVIATGVLVRYGDPVEVAEWAMVAGLLAGYSGTTRLSYTTDLRLYAAWCATAGVRLLEVKRSHLEVFARQMEAEGRMRSTFARRPTLASFYRGPDSETPRPEAGITKRISPHSLRHSFITAALDAGVTLRDVQEAASHADPRTTMRYDRARHSLDRHATYIVAAYVAGASRQG